VRFAARLQRLGAEGFDAVLTQVARRRAAGQEVLALHTGEPDFDSPRHVVDVAVERLRAGDTHYAPTAGLPALRAAVAEEVARTRSIRVSPDQVVIVPGAKPMIYFALLALCETGDEVIYPDPSYPIYESLIRFVGATPVPLPVTMESGFSFDVDHLRSLVTPRTRMIVLNSPSNPTGGVLPRSTLEALARVCEEHDLVVLSDEIYSRIVYDGDAPSIASVRGMADRTVIVDGYSKTYAMTGWRLGYGVMGTALARQVSRLILSTLSASVTFIQPAAIQALRGPQDDVHAMVATFRRRRDLLVAGLNEIPGFRCLVPQGAFYAFPHVASLGVASTTMAEILLNEAGVAIYPGRAFGPGGEGFIRLSFAANEGVITEGLRRIRDVVARHWA
jgi:aspartate aminotransferase